MGRWSAAPESSVGVKVDWSVPVVPHRTVDVGGCIIDLPRPHARSLAGLHAIKRLVRVRATDRARVRRVRVRARGEDCLLRLSAAAARACIFVTQPPTPDAMSRAGDIVPAS